MGRIRTVKPEFFVHEALFELEQKVKLPVRISFVGLFTCCDREGRFRWRPRILKLDILPYDDVDFSKVLEALEASGFVERYEVDGSVYGRIPSWGRHQVINNREMASEIPAPGDQEDPAKKEGFVYLALSPGLKRFKIGFAERDPVRRVHDLSCGSAEELELIEAIPGPRSLEQQIHKALKTFAHRREWFECSTDAARVLDAWFTDTSRVAHAASGEEEGKRKGKGKGRERDRSLAPSKLDADAPQSPEFIRIPLNSGEYVVRESEICEWETLYPALDVKQEIREVLAWNLANPTKRKTATGVREHIRRWLSKAQDLGGSRRDYGNHGNGRSGAEATRVLDDLERIAAGGIA